MKNTILFIMLATLLLLHSENKLLGTWKSKTSSKGNTTSVVFKKDSTFEGFINQKPFTSGTYSFSAPDSTLKIIEYGCSGIQGVYKVNFYSESDSLRFTAIIDSCHERRQGIEKLVMGIVD